ncbi:hypothetical protein CY34DRAFT_576650 [Suillus luteus UH-Slu-Lm8-n1]|uniref:Uncharacterized protein n=1 Tax=Suillus luteus UH-Slu-Lm8-n1 TaxID=930992 RepID=A0A0C9ZD10_9AGAM|nr:hypothetical protein CY34DRAFT_576650 [Suillus luteus UH-Slu-Lm8-n1]
MKSRPIYCKPFSITCTDPANFRQASLHLITSSPLNSLHVNQDSRTLLSIVSSNIAEDLVSLLLIANNIPRFHTFMMCCRTSSNIAQSIFIQQTCHELRYCKNGVTKSFISITQDVVTNLCE